jgi:Leucine-rich repeat (LRR) protein
MRTLLMLIVLLCGDGLCAYEDSIVHFEDKKLEQIVSETLGIPIPLTRNDLNKLLVLENYGGTISSLSGLEYAGNLKKLVISDNEITDLTPLKNMRNLKELGLWGNRISDVNILEGLKNLEVILLNDNIIVDISALTSLKKIKKLTLQKNPLDELSYKSEIKIIKLNNPGIVVYDDKVNPAKSLDIAKTLCLGLLIIAVFCVILIAPHVCKNRA